ncbi:MAG: inositol monophosphatase family protein, partial [Alkalispirochaeta sp.]
LVALVVRGEPQVGVIYCPPTGEMVGAAVGLGAWDEYGRRLHVSYTTTVETAWFLTTDPADLLKRHPDWAVAVMGRSAAVRTWADAYGYMLVARGDADAIADPIMSPWDIAPLGVIIREAGGVFTDFSGQERAIGTSALAAASPELHSALLAIAHTD